jgi:WD40 repeat protein
MLHRWQGHSREVSSLHVSPDGQYLASGSLDGLVVIWQTEDHAEKRSFQHRRDVVSCVRWSTDGSRLATAIGGWSEGVQPALIVLELESGAESRFDLEQSAGAITWLKDPHLLITAGWDGHAIVWDLDAGTQRWDGKVHKEEVSSAAWCALCPLTLRMESEDL